MEVSTDPKRTLGLESGSPSEGPPAQPQNAPPSGSLKGKPGRGRAAERWWRGWQNQIRTGTGHGKVGLSESGACGASGGRRESAWPGKPRGPSAKK